ncbi:NAD(P)H-hydrate dehydratase [Thermithiobacillus tepidarius DSM 3134]|uniref:NAD(P)H-hydrate dehydratase n=1 Tax=Thermithiobacillus tepidarius TaxID=929 RepID=UPI0004024C80|nr:NAD(P)H-hydrate dehydratase [Thermithiobacillus tepidarius]
MPEPFTSTSETLRWPALTGLPPRRADSHKGDYGHVLVLGGASGMGGAAALAALAAYRCGAGLVTVACHPDSRAHLAAWVPEAMARDWPGTLRQWNRPGVVLAVGPGLGTGLGSHTLVEEAAGLDAPQVWDADALNLLAIRGPALLPAGPVRLLTPHPGEAARLLGCDTIAVQADRAAAVRRIARRYRCICVLKGHQTLLSDGERLARCELGNPGMASGGMGDALTGILSALLGQRMDPWAAACFGVCLHARAGDVAAAHCGQTSLLARDLIDSLAGLLKEQ